MVILSKLIINIFVKKEEARDLSHMVLGVSTPNTIWDNTICRGVEHPGIIS